MSDTGNKLILTFSHNIDSDHDSDFWQCDHCHWTGTTTQINYLPPSKRID